MKEHDFKKNRVWGPEPHFPLVEKCSTWNKYGALISVMGPCSIESKDQIHEIAHSLYRHNVRYLRGGVFRAGTYPGYNFGLIDTKLIREFSLAAHQNSMECVMEVLDYSPNSYSVYDKYADCFQVGARQMQNYQLLHELAKSGKKIFLKRNMGSNLFEFLGAAEHILKVNNKAKIVLIERGSSTFMNHVRWDLSISLIPAIKQITQIPIIVDASHGTGRRDLVEPMTMAGLAAGADGFLVEVHKNPEKSLSDSDQAYPLSDLPIFFNRVNSIREVIK